MTSLQIYLLLAPVLMVVFALVIFVLTGWEDRRDDRRRAAREAASHQT